MESTEINLPSTNLFYDFIIIYNGERINVSKFLLAAKCDFFKKNEILISTQATINAKFSIDSFKYFLDIVYNNKFEISEKNFEELLELSQTFGYKELSSSILEFIKKRPFIKKMVQQLVDNDNEENKGENVNSENVNSRLAKELIIAQHLDESIQCGILCNLNVSTLVRIFNSPQRKLDNNHLLFEFVYEMLEKINNNENIINNENIKDRRNKTQILTSCLDYEEMSSDEIGRLVSHPLFSESFQPMNSKTIIKKVYEKMKEIDEIKEIKEKIDRLELAISGNSKDEFKPVLLESLEDSKYEQSPKQINEITKKFDDLFIKQEKILKDVNERLNKMSNDLNNIKSRVQQNEDIDLQNKQKGNEIVKIIPSNQSISEFQQSQQTTNLIYNLDNNDQNKDINDGNNVHLKNETTPFTSELDESRPLNGIITHLINEYKNSLTILSQNSNDNNNNNGNDDDNCKDIKNKESKTIVNENSFGQTNNNNNNKAENISKVKNDFALVEDFLKHDIICITGNISSGTFSSIINYNFVGNDCYFSSNDPNSFILFDFNKHSVLLSAYSIKSSNNKNPFFFLKSWVIEGSNCMKRWAILDKHDNNPVLCQKGKIVTFPINTEINQYFQYIRLKLTGKDSSKSTFHIDLTNVEFFGQYK